MSTPLPARVAFDPTPLTAPADRTAVRQWNRAQSELNDKPGGLPRPVAIMLLVLLGLAFGTLFLTMLFGVLASVWESFGDDVASGTRAVLIGVPFVLIVALAVLLIVRRLRRASTRGYRLDRFARANGMSYVPKITQPALPGMIFSRGTSRESTDLVRGGTPRFVEFANYEYTTGSGKSRSTHRWGYVAIKLDVPLPNIVLDAKGNNSMFGTNLPVALDKQQRLSLEGNFDDSFTLYCPKDYERDALYLFTPDIMARFIDHAAALDVEIVDNWLFLYSRRDLSTIDPETWAWIFATVRALLEKLAQWARWRDERLQMDASAQASGELALSGLATAPAAAASAIPFAGDQLRTPPPGVAAGGRRLKRAVPWPSIVIVGAVVLCWILGQSGVFGPIVAGFFD